MARIILVAKVVLCSLLFAAAMTAIMNGCCSTAQSEGSLFV
jgi:hypothetical protein